MTPADVTALVTGQKVVVFDPGDKLVAPKFRETYPPFPFYAEFLRVLQPETGLLLLRVLGSELELYATHQFVQTIWVQYTIFDRPSDYPRYIVMREFHIVHGIDCPIPGECHLFESVDMAHASAPETHVWMPRRENDNPKIVGCYV